VYQIPLSICYMYINLYLSLYFLFCFDHGSKGGGGGGGEESSSSSFSSARGNDEWECLVTEAAGERGAGIDNDIDALRDISEGIIDGGRIAPGGNTGGACIAAGGKTGGAWMAGGGEIVGVWIAGDEMGGDEMGGDEMAGDETGTGGGADGAWITGGDINKPEASSVWESSGKMSLTVGTV